MTKKRAGLFPSVIAQPDGCPVGKQYRHMDGILNIPELVQEFVTRRDYIAFYLGFVGFWCLWLSARGFWLGGTKAFGWRAADATGAAAIATGRAWLVIASGLLAAGATLWFAG